MQWSNGSVESREDLYSPEIFGTGARFGSDRGGSTGEPLGLARRLCGDEIKADEARARYRNMGKINLKCLYRHPLTGALLLFVPVLPIGYRVDAYGRPNRVGLKYEAVFDAHARQALTAPPMGSDEYAKALLRGDPELDAAICDLIGTRGEGATRLGARDYEANNLLELLWDSIARLSEDVDVIARGCGLVVALTGTI